jgi:hypothetical protein
MLTETARVTLVRAQQGDAKSQFDIGHMYFHGEGVPQDYTEALLWLHKAADQGDAKAQYGIGYMYHNGKGVPQSDAEALIWYRKAADQGDAKAQNNLGSMYFHGQTVPQDYAEALRWYRKAADQRDAMAQYNIGYMYSHGQGVPQDRTEALRWYRKAAAQGDEYAKRALRSKMSAFEIIDLSVFLLGGLIILISSQLPKNKIPVCQRRHDALAGILILFSVGLSLFRYSNIGILLSISTFRTFMFARFLLDGIVIAMLLMIVASKIAKVLLQISVISLIVFNLFAIVYHSQSRIEAAIRLFTMTNGLLIGMIIVLSIILWRTDSENRERLTRIGEPTAPDPSSASGTDSLP